ncbi:hypothetical protein QZH41_005074 [Actinostola sp. cb2023]|nr:hypothetical protein QZH41_005074 [Actinostola sp. cb2023]
MAAITKTSFVDQYLKRLQYSGPVLPNLQTLQLLHHRHMLMIPFENLSNIQNEEYANTKDELFEKIIQGRRGGVCFELNSLFAFLLRDLGFDVTIVGAAVYLEISNTFTPPNSHQVSIVTLEGEQWLADVGFGDGFTVPLRLVEDEIQDGGGGFHRLKRVCDEDNVERLALESQGNNEVQIYFGAEQLIKNDCSEWLCKYKFTTKPCSLSDFSDSKTWILANPDSPLNKGFVCSALRPWGRMTLTGSGKLIRTYIENKKVVKRDVEVLQNREDVWLTLEKEFGVTNNR